MGIATYDSKVFSSMKQILNDVHDADVFVVTLFREVTL
jgi:small basic protein